MKNRWNFVRIVALTVVAAGLAYAQEAPEPPNPPEPPSAPEPPMAPFMMAYQNTSVSTVGSSARDKERMERDAERARERDEHAYRKGQSYLDKRDYQGAIDAFNDVITEKSGRVDGALYWRAYAENKLGKRSEALATLAELKKNYPNSRWLEDAGALQVEVRSASGSPVSPENATDEDLKLLALNSLINTEPERTLPILEKLLKSSNTPRVKERALFVLAQSHSPQARELIASVAKGKFNPDLQMKAIEYLSVYGGRENAQTLADIYKSSNDVQVKRSILHGYMVSGSRDMVLSIAKTESNPELRVDAIRQLGVMGGSAELLQLYTPDAPFEVKRAVLQGLFVGGQADKILEIARNDKDPAMRREAIRQLGPMGRKGGEGLPALYAKETDVNNKKEILNALFIQGNAAGIVEIARKETDPTLKRAAVDKLSIMHSKEGTDYLMELLNK